MSERSKRKAAARRPLDVAATPRKPAREETQAKRAARAEREAAAAAAAAATVERPLSRAAKQRANHAARAAQAKRVNRAAMDPHAPRIVPAWGEVVTTRERRLPEAAQFAHWAAHECDGLAGAKAWHVARAMATADRRVTPPTPEPVASGMTRPTAPNGGDRFRRLTLRG